jgi:hypothetical protein
MHVNIIGPGNFLRDEFLPLHHIHFGSIIPGESVCKDNSMEEEIQYRITLGNKAYYANQFFLEVDWSLRSQN